MRIITGKIIAFYGGHWMHTMQSDGIFQGFIVLYVVGFHTLGVMLN